MRPLTEGTLWSGSQGLTLFRGPYQEHTLRARLGLSHPAKLSGEDWGKLECWPQVASPGYLSKAGGHVCSETPNPGSWRLWWVMVSDCSTVVLQDVLREVCVEEARATDGSDLDSPSLAPDHSWKCPSFYSKRVTSAVGFCGCLYGVAFSC